MFKIFKKFGYIEWIFLCLLVFVEAGQVYFDLALPEYMGKIINQIVAGEGISALWHTGFFMLLITLGTSICDILIGLVAAYVSSSFSKHARSAIFEKVSLFSAEEMNNFSTASLLTRTTNDVAQVQQTLIMFARFGIYAPAIAIGAIIKITGKSFVLSGVTGIAMGVMIIGIAIIMGLSIPKFTKIQKQTDALNGISRENLTGLKVIRAYNAENLEEQKFEKCNGSLTKTVKFVNKATSFITPSMNLVMSGLSLAIIWIGSYIVKDNPAFLADTLIFMQYSAQVLVSFMMLTMFFAMLPRAIVSGKRINAVLKSSCKIFDGNLENPQTKIKGAVEFKNVEFKYPNADGNVLSNINLKIEPGEFVAFIGSTGSGKSTLINLVPRFYDATNGEVLVDGVNVKDYKLFDLHEKIGYVPQKGVLFSGSIEKNIKFGRENYSKKDVKNALDVAQASEFVDKFEGKTSYNISQGGKNVSGGQKQRLSIARAIIKQPEIYIFDDSFSALDYKTDKALRVALKKQKNKATYLVVAQRIGTIMNADKIVVLDSGKIVGIGKHKELLKNCEVYKQIALSQLSKEELKHGK